MKKSVLLALMLIGFASEAQIKRYSFKAAANYPIIPSVTTQGNQNIVLPTNSGYYSYIVVPTIKESFDAKTGFDFGGTLDYGVHQKIFLTTGLQVSYLRFKQVVSIESISNGTNTAATSPYPIGTPMGALIPRSGNGELIALTQSENVGKTTTLYLQAPVLVGVSLLKDKLLIRGGATFSFLLNATIYKSQSSYNGTAFVASEYKDNTKEGYTNVMASGTVQATYLITKRIGVDFSFNKYFTPIYSNTNQSKKAKYNVLSLGLSYNLSK